MCENLIYIHKKMQLQQHLTWQQHLLPVWCLNYFFWVGVVGMHVLYILCVCKDRSMLLQSAPSF